MVEQFGVERVFKDVDNIDPGDDFVERITSAVGSCAVLLAVIGPQWLTIVDDETGRRRLDNPNDLVRLEIQTALTRNVRVIPVLIDGTQMPRAIELPTDLAPLVRRQAVEFSPKSDPGRLVATVRDTLAEQTGVINGTIPNLSGEWVDTDGVNVRLTHVGNEVVILLLSGGHQVGNGNATITGDQLQLSVYRSDLGQGIGAGTISPDGKQISGVIRYGIQSFGFSISKRW